ncbi:hypothetical protein [Heyndrickxia vini]|uniref:Uncharacterized protein n=1 Tax=Heyndrickxia vini TaxID=1476025 RepID=A0ABX7E3A5_9BACI|nr:hypothetical protein [Heyndrickxia vini]QQZ09793.1 hypothetical protein I5776_02095 [Heyndrickxia vini]
MRRKRKPALKIIVFTLIIILLCLLLYVIFSQSSKDRATSLVEDFYQYEKAGNFGGSWTLFHPLMKKKFSQEDYIQRRAHVFMQDFGVKTFSYTVGKAQHLKSWTFSKESPKFKNTYQVPITQTFKSEFGVFTIHQDVYVVEEKDKSYILWSYKK